MSPHARTHNLRGHIFNYYIDWKLFLVSYSIFTDMSYTYMIADIVPSYKDSHTDDPLIHDIFFPILCSLSPHCMNLFLTGI